MAAIHLDKHCHSWKRMLGTPNTLCTVTILSSTARCPNY
jgi:hypothetical protein